MAVYCGLDFYKTEDINTLINSAQVDGIVVGDWFCQRKMFENGEPQFYNSIDLVGASSKKLIYQTPIYITSRNRIRVIDIIKHIDSLYAGSVVLTQDIGLLKFVRDNCRNVECAWSRMGRTRESAYNTLFYETLKELDVRLFETESISVADKLKGGTMLPWLVYGNNYYKTIGRRCYTKYELNVDDEECSKFCRESIFELESIDSSYRMSIDGYILGSNLKYSSDVWQRHIEDNDVKIVIYAHNMADLESRILL